MRDGLLLDVMTKIAKGQPHGPLIPALDGREVWVPCTCGRSFPGPGLTWRHGPGGRP